MIYAIKYGKIYKDIGRTRSSAEILRKIKFNKYRKFSIPIPKPLPHDEGLCMLCWLCICAIVVVCCRCVLHRLCSTTCMRPCIEPFGIHAWHPCQGYFAGAIAPRPYWGLRPSTPLLKDRAFLKCVAGHEVLPKNIFLIFERKQNGRRPPKT